MNFGVRIFYLIKNYSFHSELDRFVTNDDYSIKKAYVLSNSHEI